MFWNRKKLCNSRLVDVCYAFCSVLCRARVTENRHNPLVKSLSDPKVFSQAEYCATSFAQQLLISADDSINHLSAWNASCRSTVFTSDAHVKKTRCRWVFRICTLYVNNKNNELCMHNLLLCLVWCVTVLCIHASNARTRFRLFTLFA